MQIETVEALKVAAEKSKSGKWIIEVGSDYHRILCGKRWIAEMVEDENYSGDYIIPTVSEMESYADFIVTANPEIILELLSTLSATQRELETCGMTMERERTELAAAISRIGKAIAPRLWLKDSRGCYEYDDENYQKEFGYALDEVLEAIEPLRKIAADWTHCPKNSVGVESARTDWKVKFESEQAAHQVTRRALELLTRGVMEDVADGVKITDKLVELAVSHAIGFARKEVGNGND